MSYVLQCAASLLMSMAFLSSCTMRGQERISPPPVPREEPTRAFVGEASYYGDEFNGRKTANGEIYSHDALTAAHRSLPFGTRVRVTNLHNKRSVTLRVNDRGPFLDGRVIDVSKSAAEALGMITSGTVPVRVEVLDQRPS